MCKDYWFSKYNRVLLHYSVSIAAAAAYIHLSAAAVYTPVSVIGGGGVYPSVSAAAVVYIPQALVARTLPLFPTFCLQIYFQ